MSEEKSLFRTPLISHHVLVNDEVVDSRGNQIGRVEDASEAQEPRSRSFGILLIPPIKHELRGSLLPACPTIEIDMLWTLYSGRFILDGKLPLET